MVCERHQSVTSTYHPGDHGSYPCRFQSKRPVEKYIINTFTTITIIHDIKNVESWKQASNIVEQNRDKLSIEQWK